jgi:gliding motility-associated-like protein
MNQSNVLFDRFMLMIAFSLVIVIGAFAQVEPQPCDDPDNEGVGCYCDTAGILCTPDELDGFEFAMSDVANTGDLSGDLCPELSDGGSPHNVNFFAFIVWCETLTFNVLVSNCAPGTNTGTNFNNFGIQMALFANCPASDGGNWNTVECVTNGNETCFNSAAAVPPLQTFSASGLEIGATYYFMVDGCFRSTCKVTIDVQGVCGNGEIDPWTNGIFGPQNVCVGDTETYIAEDILVGLDGAEEYYYYLDGAPIDDGEELYTTDITWSTVGTYTLCVDVSNLPCVPESDTPAQDCITIIVTDPGDGDIDAVPNPLCPDETTTITVSNNNTDPLLSQYIVIVGPDGLVVQVVQGLTTTLTYDLCGEFIAYYYSFVTTENPTLPTVGNTWTLPDCTAECCYVDEVTITFEDDEDPVFTIEPPDETIDCAEDIIEDEELTWTDNCAGTGTVIPTVVEDFTNCDGGTVTRTWSFIDSCANEVEYIQIITIDPIAIPVFISPPADSIIDCDIAQIFLPTDLEYNNSGTGGCNIMGIVSPTAVGTFDLCGSSVTYTWEYTDVCMRTITYSQVVTVEEVGEANEFINPPNDTTITCLEWLTFTPATLNYSNGLNGGCEISGSVLGTTTDVHDPCGNSITFSWEFTDVCNRTITHTQVVTVEQMLEADYVNPPGDVTINCDELQTFTPAVLMYTNGGTGACLIDGTIDAVGDGTLDTCGNSVIYTWDFTDECGRFLTHSQTVTVDPIPEASFVNPPGNVSIDCNALLIFTPAVLLYTNAGTGNCLIEGTIDAVGDGILDTCGNSVIYTWEFTDQCGRTITHNQTVTVVPILEASFVNPPGNVTISCDELQTFVPTVLSYTNGDSGNCLIEGTIDPVGDGTLDTCGNSVTYTWEFTDQCNRTITHSQIVTVDPIPEASFVNPPGNATISCDELQTFIPAILTYTNGGFGNCLIEGTIDPVGDGTLDTCGNSVTYTWDFTDQCGRPITHSQTVTVEPIPEASYVNPPPNVTITCDELQMFTPTVLSYTNGGTGACLIEGTIDPVGDGTLDICGNSVTYTWDFTDQCGRPITHSQTVTVEPIPEASYVNPPPNVTITCDELQTFIPTVLSYTNGGTGACLIEGTVDPVGDGTLDICGNTITYTWDFTDECGRPITHSQTVTVEPIPEASYIDPPPNVTITCDELQVFVPTVLSYTNGGTGACLIEGTVDPVGDGTLDICGNTVTYTWDFTDQCGRPITHSQTVTVEPIPEATYIDIPGDITLNCDELQAFTPAILSFTNGGVGDCLIEGTTDPVGDGTLDACGNSVTFTWEHTDDCNRLISHNQTVTVEPIAPPTFIDPPSDMTVLCGENPSEGDGPDLSYTNGGVDDCETAGAVSPIEDYNVTECGGSIVYTWMFTDDCGNPISHSQTITVDPAPQAQLENLPSSNITIECSENTGTGPDLLVTNNETGDCLIEETISPVIVGDADICGGTFQFLWEFTDDCGRVTSFSQTVNVNPAPVASFDNIPTDIDIECSENADAPQTLSYSNGETGDCEISGTVPGIRSGGVDYCGGVLLDTWEFIDECGRLITTERDVNVAPAPIAEYINPPGDIIVDCSNVNSIPAALNYNNGESGICLISGVSIAVVSGSFDACGGELIYTWTFVDACGRPISHSQNITVSPAQDPVFIDPPQDITIGCEDIYPGVDNLNYTNGANIPCAISGLVIPTSVQVDNIITNTWELILPCSGDILEHTQVVTLSIIPEISVSPASIFLCIEDSYDLGDVIVVEANGTNISLTYHDAFPPTAANEISSVVSPNSDFIYVINAVNEFGCEDFELVSVFVELPPYAGEDQSTTVCSDGIPINLYDYLPPFVDQGGSWLDLDGIGANISNPFGATFNNVSPGNYSLYYIVYSTTVCDNDTMVLNIEVIDNVSFEILEVTCIGSFDFYEVYINSNGFDIQATEGDIINITGNEYVITNIPITTGVFISAFEIISGCSITEFIDIPNCDCPDIDPPVGNDISICIDEQPIVLSVTVPPGMTANWYYDQSSSTSFLDGSTDFTVQDSSAGTYSYYVETYDPTTDCTSNVKLKIDVEINDLPVVIDSFVNICDIDNDGTETVSLQSFNSVISSNPANTFSYFETLANAESDTDELTNNYDLSLGSVVLFVKVENSANCANIAQLELILNDLPIAAVETTAPSCFGESDGLIEVTATDVDGIMMTSLDGITFDQTNVYNGLSSGLHTVYVQDENGCINTYDVTILDGLDIFLTVFTAECNDNGTNTDPDDDFYTITLLIENNNSNTGTYYVIFDGSVQYTFSYGSSESFTIPIDEGNTIDIAVSDFVFLCSKEQTFGPLNPCSTNCEVNIDVLDFECNDNNTGTDPTDDFYTVTINASALNGSQNNTYNVFLGGVLFYNFTYGQDETFEVDADGNNLNITCQDNEDIQCQTSLDIGPLSPCSDGCQIDLDIISVECSNNGTSTNQNDDFYTFTINGNIINGSNLSQFELFIDGISQGFFNYGEDVIFDIPADELTHIIGISDDSNANCEDDFTTVVLSNCSTDCEIIQNTLNEVCFDNGTPEDSSDDYYEITINISSINGATNQLFNLYVDATFIGDYAYDVDHTITILADNMIHTLLYQDSEELACELEVSTSTLLSCSGSCLIELVIENFECFDNNTATVLDDDYYEFDLTGLLLNGDSNSSYELYTDGGLVGTYNYDELVSVTLSADNLVHTFLIIDTMDPDCTFEIQTGNLISCSTDCEIVLDEITYVCFDNNTPTDPTDDFIEISINVSAINGATNNMFNLYFDGVLEGIFTYGSTEVFTVPADGQNITIRFQDSQDLQCDMVMDSETLSPCSDGCLIGLNIVNIQCFNNGTPTDVNDDYYEISIEGEVLNGTPSSNFEVFVDNISQGTSGYGVAYVVTLPADNTPHLIEIVDGDDSGCTSSFTTDALTSCSTDCEIAIDVFTFICFDNGTLDDPSDDYYELNLTASAINGSNGFELTISGVSEGTFNYGVNVNLTFPADGSNIILILTDLNDEQCKFNQAVGPLDPCSDLCTIEPMIIDSQCFDNGTPIDPSDDYWEITIFVNPANGETAPTYDLSVDSNLEGTYPYSQNVVITISADNSTHLINVNDTDDVNCDASITTSVLSFCSTPCEVSASFDNVTCDNNGTNDTGNDDIYYVDLLVNNPSAGQFNIPSLFVVGDYNQSINIGPFNISDGNIILTIFDADQNLCFIELELIPPSPCSECIQTVDAGDGGTISCETTEINLLGSSSEDGSYSWYGPAGNLVSQSLDAIAVSIGTYTFSVIFEDGCVAEDEVEVLADTDLPVASLSSDGDLTCIKQTSILDGSSSGSVDEFFFYWFDEDGNLLSEDQIFETNTAGVYFLQVESISNNCKSGLVPVIVDAFLNEPSAVIYAEPSNVINCVIESIILTTDEEDNVNYIWSINGVPIDNTFEIEISDIGTYGLMAIDTITGCTGIADLIISSLVDYPNINLDVPQMLDCDSEEAIIVATSIHSGDNVTSYWEDSNLNIIAENQDTLEVTEPGEYLYTLIDNNNGCQNTDTVLIELFENDVEIITIPEITYIDGQSVILSATVNLNSSEIESIQWTPDENMTCPTCLITQINNPLDSIYFIEVVDIYGCADTAMVRLIRKDRPEVYIPNVLNVNSNSGNDKFKIFGNDEVASILKMQIYDRWGNLIYLSVDEQLNNNDGWDGTFNGKFVEQGVYVYIIEVLLLDGSTNFYYGDLSVIR